MSEEDTDDVSIPIEIIQEVMFQTDYEKRKPDWIADLLKKQGYPYIKDDVVEMIKRFNKESAKEKQLYRLEWYATKRRKDIDDQRKLGFSSDTPTIIRQTFTYKKEEKKRTDRDIIRIFIEKGCYYCQQAKRDGSFQQQLNNLKKKYGGKFHIFEVEVLTNPIFSMMDKSLRADLQHEITNLGLLPPFFDWYFPTVYIQSPTQGILPEFWRGIDVRQIEVAVDFIIANKPLPESFFSLPSLHHTGAYIEKVALGINVKYSKAKEKTALI